MAELQTYLAASVIKKFGEPGEVVAQTIAGLEARGLQPGLDFELVPYLGQPTSVRQNAENTVYAGVRGVPESQVVRSVAFVAVNSSGSEQLCVVTSTGGRNLLDTQSLASKLGLESLVLADESKLEPFGWQHGTVGPLNYFDSFSSDKISFVFDSEMYEEQANQTFVFSAGEPGWSIQLNIERYLQVIDPDGALAHDCSEPDLATEIQVKERALITFSSHATGLTSATESNQLLVLGSLHAVERFRAANPGSGCAFYSHQNLDVLVDPVTHCSASVERILAVLDEVFETGGYSTVLVADDTLRWPLVWDQIQARKPAAIEVVSALDVVVEKILELGQMRPALVGRPATLDFLKGALSDLQPMLIGPTQSLLLGTAADTDPDGFLKLAYEAGEFSVEYLVDLRQSWLDKLATAYALSEGVQGREIPGHKLDHWFNLDGLLVLTDGTEEILGGDSKLATFMRLDGRFVGAVPQLSTTSVQFGNSGENDDAIDPRAMSVSVVDRRSVAPSF